MRGMAAAIGIVKGQPFTPDTFGGKKDEAPRRKRASQLVSRGRHNAYISVRLMARAAPVGG